MTFEIFVLFIIYCLFWHHINRHYVKSDIMLCYYMMWHIPWQWQKQGIDQTVNSQSTRHTSPSWGSFGVSFLSILEENYSVIKRFDCICDADKFQIPVENSVEKTLCCWLCTSGPISINARTDRRGYCPGEKHHNVGHDLYKCHQCIIYSSAYIYIKRYVISFLCCKAYVEIVRIDYWCFT